MAQLPLKTRILQYALQQDGSFTVNQILDGVKAEYAGEKCCNAKLVDEYFQSFIGIGFFEQTDLQFDEKGELVTYCKATDYARERCKSFF